MTDMYCYPGLNRSRPILSSISPNISLARVTSASWNAGLLHDAPDASDSGVYCASYIMSIGDLTTMRLMLQNATPQPKATESPNLPISIRTSIWSEESLKVRPTEESDSWDRPDRCPSDHVHPNEQITTDRNLLVVFDILL